MNTLSAGSSPPEPRRGRIGRWSAMAATLKELKSRKTLLNKCWRWYMHDMMYATQPRQRCIHDMCMPWNNIWHDVRMTNQPWHDICMTWCIHDGCQRTAWHDVCNHRSPRLKRDWLLVVDSVLRHGRRYRGPGIQCIHYGKFLLQFKFKLIRWPWAPSRPD